MTQVQARGRLVLLDPSLSMTSSVYCKVSVIPGKSRCYQVIIKHDLMFESQSVGTLLMMDVLCPGDDVRAYLTGPPGPPGPPGGLGIGSFTFNPQEVADHVYSLLSREY